MVSYCGYYASYLCYLHKILFFFNKSNKTSEAVPKSRWCCYAWRRVLLLLHNSFSTYKNESKEKKDIKQKLNKDKSEPDISAITFSRNEYTKDSENVIGSSYSLLPQLPTIKGIGKK